MANRHRRAPLVTTLAAIALGVAVGTHAMVSQPTQRVASERDVAPAQLPTECDTPDAGWLMCEDFEDGGLGWPDWFAQSSFVECLGCRDGDADPGRIHLVRDADLAHSGDWSLAMPAAAETGYQGASLTYRDCAGEKRPGCRLTGHEQLHFRTHVRLAADHQYVHHFLSLAGTRPDRYWDCDGNAGCRPNGFRAVGTTVDFNRQHELFFYTYFPEMQCDRGGYCSGEYAQRICDGCAQKEMPCTNGPECCWGNHFGPQEPVVLPRGPWVCLEMMMRLNTPGEADGEMAFWVDGVLAHRQQGMHWRDVSDLQLNKAWLQHYIATGDADQSNQVWFDDVVVSAERIGCAAAAPSLTTPVTPAPTASIPPATASPIATPTEPPLWRSHLPSLQR